MSGILVYLVLIIIAVLRFANQSKKNPKSGSRNTSSSAGASRTTAGRTARRPSGNSPMASDGHRVSKDQDISCRRYGHNHPEFDIPRFIPHEDPEEGYIILNGVKMKLTEADKYEDRI